MRMEELRENPQNARRPNENPGLLALKRGAALVERPGRGLLRLTGKDPVGMLNAVITNNVPTDAGRGTYALLLNPKGRVQSDLRVLKAGVSVLVDTEPEGADATREILGRYAPFSRVKLEDLSDTWAVLGLYGPSAGELLAGPGPAEHGTTGVEVGDVTLLAAGVAAPVPGYDLLGPLEAVTRARETLLERGAVPAGPDAHETVRVWAGVPRFGSDLTPENFPGEAGILGRSVDFGKGCYPGQETVARMRYRGHPNRTLYRVSHEGYSLAPGAPILQGEKTVGTVTSVAPLSVDGVTVALCYLSRNADLHAPLVTGDGRVEVLGEVS